MLVASTGLDQAELTERLSDIWGMPGVRPVPGQTRFYDLTTTLTSFVVVVAPTYAEALRDLLTTWEPDHPAKAITSAKHWGGGWD